MAFKRYGVGLFEGVVGPLSFFTIVLDKYERTTSSLRFPSVTSAVFAGGVFFVAPVAWDGHAVFSTNNLFIVSIGKMAGIWGRQHFLYFLPESQMQGLLRSSFMSGFQSKPFFGLR